MIKHKEALYEIFEKERVEPSGVLYDACEIILKSAGIDLPKDVYNFIALGDWFLEDIVTGNLTDKYVIINQDIICGAVPKDAKTAEEDAEDASYEIARLVRTLLKANKKLVSTSYSTGVAKTSVLLRATSEAIVYSDSRAHIVVVSLEIRMQEEN